MTCRQLRLVGFIIGAASIALLASDAEARWGSRGSWGSSGGSSGGSWGSSGGSWGSSGGSWGSSGGSSGGYRHARRYRRAYRSSGGSWGSSGGSYGSYGSYGSGGGSYGYSSSFSSYGSAGGYASTYSRSTPVYNSTPSSGDVYYSQSTPTTNAQSAVANSSSSVSSDSVLIAVSVPTDATVFVNGYETKSVGANRTYVSRGLTNGQRYRYEIRAQVERNGQTATDSKLVYVVPGQTSNLAFNLPAEGATSEPSVVSQPDVSDEAPKTTLRLKVPADAKVSIAGATTRSKGPVRVFTTRRLAAGKTWSDYVVRAEVEREGKQLTREVSIDLAAGETRALTIDFETADVTTVAASKR